MLTIRRATDRDIEPVHALLAGSFLPTYAPLAGPDLADALHRRWHSTAALREQAGRADGVFLIAEDGAGLVAHAYAAEGAPSFLIIFRLYVALPEQGRGIGTALLERIYAEVPSADVVRLDVLAGNARALSFYERRGFQQVGRSEADRLVSLRMERVIPR